MVAKRNIVYNIENQKLSSNETHFRERGYRAAKNVLSNNSKQFFSVRFKLTIAKPHLKNSKLS